MIVELRQYTLHPGRRDELIDLFEQHFVEPQEELGMAVLGQFRDLDRPDMFVWLRGFADLAARGPAANATMIDSDDVLLLRAIVPPPAAPRDATAGRPVLRATIWHRDRPFDDTFTRWFTGLDTGAVAVLSTEYAPNDFPALPVREGEHVFVWLARETGEPVEVPGHFGVHRTERLRLEPTGRSALR